MVSTSWRPTRCSGQDIPPNAGVEPGDDPHKHPSTRDETATAKPRAMRSNCTRVATRDQTGSYRHKEQPAHRGGPAMPKHPIEASQAIRCDHQPVRWRHEGDQDDRDDQHHHAMRPELSPAFLAKQMLHVCLGAPSETVHECAVLCPPKHFLNFVFEPTFWAARSI